MAELTGTTTTGERELLVQNFYFAFVFVQLFLVVSISSGITGTLDKLLDDPSTAGQTFLDIPEKLAQDLPKAADYFFSYMILQAFSISSGTLLQIAAVLILLFSSFLDTTPRQKVSRVLSRPGITWGNMIPVYTNFGAIGLIYAVIAPLLMVVLIITFSLFWFTYRYQMIYVSYAKAETNGLIFPKAINQLFTGLYFLEITLVGLFLLQTKGESSCFPQAIVMIVTLIFTVLFQYLLNHAFGPLFKYLPITFEDEAVERDQEFQRAQATRWQSKNDGEGAADDEHTSLNSELSAREKAERRESRRLEEQDRRRSTAQTDGAIELKQLESTPSNKYSTHLTESPERTRRGNWAERSRDRSRSHSHSHHDDPTRSPSHTKSPRKSKDKKHKQHNPLDLVTNAIRAGVDDLNRPIRDIEAQTLPTANLFDNIDDQLEDIEPEARQKLIKRSFQHPATRAIQPAIWVPHDELGVATDEIRRTGEFSRKIWITSVNARVDASGKVLYRGLPPDRDPFENMEV